jgi:tetratricopeptide (TPR) repeat protein
MSDYRIRRNRSALSSGALFNGQRRSSWFQPLLIANLLMLAFAGFIAWQFPAAQKIALNAIGSAPTSTPNAVEYAQRADRAYWRGDLNAAVTNYRLAVQERPDDVSIMFELGRMLIFRSYEDRRNEKDRDEALSLSDQAITADPQNARGYTLRCYAQTELENYEGAVRDCLQALDFNSQDAEAHSFLARAYEGSGRFAESTDEALKAVQINPQSIEANITYGDLLMTRKQYDLALNYYEQAMKVNPQLSQPYYNLAALYRVMSTTMGEPDLLEKAIGYYNTVLSSNRRSIKAYIRLCQTYMQSGQFNLAKDNCTTATTLDVDATEAWRYLGEVLYRTSNYDDAIKAFVQCSDREKDLPPGERQWQCWAYQALSHVLMQRCSEAYPLLYDLLIWSQSTDATRLANTGLDQCGGTVPTPQGDMPTSTPITPAVVPANPETTTQG